MLGRFISAYALKKSFAKIRVRMQHSISTYIYIFRCVNCPLPLIFVKLRAFLCHEPLRAYQYLLLDVVFFNWRIGT